MTNNENTKISVIIPTHNRAVMLSMCLDSLLKQSYSKSDFEVIIVDNNSKDKTKDIVCKYISNNPDISIRYCFEDKPGLVYARHRGAKEASYEILSFTDDDAILCSDWLKEVVSVFSMNANIVAVAGRILIRWDEKPPDWVLPYEGLLGKLDYGYEIKFEKNLSINGGNFHIKKDVFYKVGGFNPDQIGDWLIGDGDTGLCHKLHENGYLIGWAPKALMEHCQTVQKNATIKDIKRRYINNGIAVPYRMFALKKGGYKALIKCLLITSKRILVLISKFVYHFIRCDKEEMLRIKFGLAYNCYQFPYVLKIISNREFREEILKTNWFED